mmetsp:Transcript_86457/g.241954  ORF Transcript_86457/g.241954 Transcript_86457/m.241954 type:complete len:221 (+) Transcript_86457:675-1337(+)
MGDHCVEGGAEAGLHYGVWHAFRADVLDADPDHRASLLVFERHEHLRRAEPLWGRWDATADFVPPPGDVLSQGLHRLLRVELGVDEKTRGREVIDGLVEALGRGPLRGVGLGIEASLADNVQLLLEAEPLFPLRGAIAAQGPSHFRSTGRAGRARRRAGRRWAWRLLVHELPETRHLVLAHPSRGGRREKAARRGGLLDCSGLAGALQAPRRPGSAPQKQ